MKHRVPRSISLPAWGVALILSLPGLVQSQPLPGGTLDPTTIPKYVTPLVIPPQMPKSPAAPPLNSAPQPAADYNIAVRQFRQQILPAGFGATTVWSYGLAEDAVPALAPAPNSTFNYPAFTVENTSGVPTSVRWINDLVDAGGNYLPHLFPIDQTLHWANPPATGCLDGTDRTDCRTLNPANYTGPVPMVTHVHGAHVNAESDGYPEAWWLPAANNIPAGYARSGTLFDQYDTTNTVPGSAFFSYENDQPAATTWYHDHSLGITRVNVYAGPAGFWLIRGGANGDEVIDNFATATANDGVLPGPAPTLAGGDPNFNASVRATIREIPVVIQDRSFNADGALFYPDNRAFFEGLNVPLLPPQIPGAGTLDIPFIPDSDIAPIWNPEFFANTMVVNGTTWPQLEVAPALYRLRLLNGCNSRTLNLTLFQMAGDTQLAERPFFQIGGDQGFLPAVVLLQTGISLPLPGDGTIPPLPAPAPDAMQALLMGPAERADVLVDFSGLPDGTVVRIFNTGPDAPFGGFPDVPADPGTTGQVMQFVVNSALTQPADAAATPPQNLILPAEPAVGPAVATRKLTLNEEESAQLCVQQLPDGSITTLFNTPNDPNFLANCTAAGGVPMAPKAALLGVLGADPVSGLPVSVPKLWMDVITENPVLGDTEEWEIFNLTMDAHPIHLHLVRFQVINRQNFDPATFAPIPGTITPPEANEEGYKDTALMYPGQVTRIRAHFDRAGLYVWHCHILEHEDNEMMRPYLVRFDPAFPDLNGDNTVDRTDLALLLAQIRSPRPMKLAFDLNLDQKVDLLDVRILVGKLGLTR